MTQQDAPTSPAPSAYQKLVVPGNEDAVGAWNNQPDVPWKIDITTQHIFPLGDVGERLSKKASDQSRDRSLGYRWARKGFVDGAGHRITLPWVQVGGTRHTSIEALNWFVHQLTFGHGHASLAMPPVNNIQTGPANLGSSRQQSGISKLSIGEP